MKKQFYAFIIVFLIFIFTSFIVKAEIFTYATSVYYRDTNASAAKQSAISLGRVVALSYVIKKITLATDNIRIEKLLTPKIALSFNTGLQISNEQISKGAYQADIRYQFSEKLVKEFLNKYKIKYVTDKLSNYLIVPTFDASTIKDDNVALFWKEIWQNISSNDYLSNFSYYEPIDNKVFTDIKYLNNLHNTLQVSDVYQVKLFRTAKHTYKSIVYSIFNKTNFETKDFDSLDDLIAEIIQNIEDPVKLQYLNSFSSVKTTKLITVKYGDIKQWANLHNIILNANGIVSTTIMEIGRTYVKMNITFNIPLQIISDNFNRQDIYFDDLNLILCDKSYQLCNSEIDNSNNLMNNQIVESDVHQKQDVDVSKTSNSVNIQ